MGHFPCWNHQPDQYARRVLRPDQAILAFGRSAVDRASSLGQNFGPLMILKMI